MKKVSIAISLAFAALALSPAFADETKKIDFTTVFIDGKPAIDDFK